MKKILGIVALAVCVFAFAAPAFAGGYKGERLDIGEIVSIDAPGNQIVIKAGSEDVTVYLDAGTRYFKDGKQVVITDLAVGDNVRARLARDKRTATTIAVQK
jgi:hypothetical protein